MKILLDIQRTFQPSAGLSYWKIGTRQMCMKWLPIIRHVNSVEQCRTVSTVSTLSTVSTVSIVSTMSTVSTVIARCYLHLRWYFLEEQKANTNIKLYIIVFCQKKANFWCLDMLWDLAQLSWWLKRLCGENKSSSFWAWCLLGMLCWTLSSPLTSAC